MKGKNYHFLKKIVLGFCVAYILVFSTVVLFQRKLIYFPKEAYPQSLVQRVLPHAENIQVMTSDNISLSSIFIPPKAISTPVLIVFHGNATLALDMSENFENLIAQGYGVLLAEYRGFGGNHGKPSEEGLYKDAEAYFLYVKDKYPLSPIILYGQSLGGGVAVDLASKYNLDIEALILEVPFFSLLSVSEEVYPFIPFKRWLLFDKYLSHDKISLVTVPKLFLLAGKDEVVGFHSGHSLFKKASEPKELVVYHDATHNILRTHPLEQDVIQFLEKYQLGIKK